MLCRELAETLEVLVEALADGALLPTLGLDAGSMRRDLPAGGLDVGKDLPRGLLAALLDRLDQDPAPLQVRLGLVDMAFEEADLPVDRR